MSAGAQDRLRAMAQAEAEYRVRRALERIENAQGELSSACADLSALVGGIQIWKSTSRLHDSVKALWYRVESFRAQRRYRLDDTNIAALKRQAEASATQ